MWKVYILKSDTDHYYVGMTKNLEKRLEEHRSGFGGTFTKRFDNLKLLYTETFKLRNEAENRERQLKGWSRAKKEALINQDFLSLQQLSHNSGLDEGRSIRSEK